MKNLKTMFIVTGIGLLFLGTIYISNAAADMKHHDKDCAFMAEELGLDKKEIETIDEIKVKYQKMDIDIKAEEKKAALDLKSAIKKDSPRDEINKLADAVLEEKKKCLKNRIDYIFEVASAIKDSAKRKTYLEKTAESEYFLYPGYHYGMEGHEKGSEHKKDKKK